MSESSRVLLADDEDLFRDTMADILRKAGYTVECASDAAEAARMLSGTKYDVLISDIRMPGNTELELVLEAGELARGLPIILVTGHPELKTAVYALNHAVSAYLIKPPDLDELLAHVKALSARSRLYRMIADLRRQLSLWETGARNFEELLQEPLGPDVTGSARLLLTMNFEMIAKSLVDLRRVTELLAASGNSTRPEEAAGPSNTPEIVETALRATIQALEESKHVFKSKRLKELRQQLQGVLGILEREKAAKTGPSLASPHYLLQTRVNR